MIRGGFSVTTVLLLIGLPILSELIIAQGLQPLVHDMDC